MMADQWWRSCPEVMGSEVIDHVALRIADHARPHPLPSVDVILHGGGPLLAGVGLIGYLADRVGAAVGDVTEFRLDIRADATHPDGDAPLYSPGCARRWESVSTVISAHMTVSGGSPSEHALASRCARRYTAPARKRPVTVSDLLASTFKGTAATGLHDAELVVPRVKARQRDIEALPVTCRNCTFRAVCGGDVEVDRCRAGNGFDNSSAYCPDLLVLIRHARDRIAMDVAALRSAR
jgi:hypothetical protein